MIVYICMLNICSLAGLRVYTAATVKRYRDTAAAAAAGYLFFSPPERVVLPKYNACFFPSLGP